MNKCASPSMDSSSLPGGSGAAASSVVCHGGSSGRPAVAAAAACGSSSAAWPFAEEVVQKFKQDASAIVERYLATQWTFNPPSRYPPGVAGPKGAGPVVGHVFGGPDTAAGGGVEPHDAVVRDKAAVARGHPFWQPSPSQGSAADSSRPLVVEPSSLLLRTPRAAAAQSNDRGGMLRQGFVEAQSTPASISGLSRISTAHRGNNAERRQSGSAASSGRRRKGLASPSDQITRHLLSARDRMEAVEAEFAQIMDELAAFGQRSAAGSVSSASPANGQAVAPALADSAGATPLCTTRDSRVEYFTIGTPGRPSVGTMTSVPSQPVSPDHLAAPFHLPQTLHSATMTGSPPRPFKSNGPAARPREALAPSLLYGHGGYCGASR